MYKVIGVMSGSSMDGVDLAYCEFLHKDGKWHFVIKVAETISYEDKWQTCLSELHRQNMEILPKTDALYGKYLGQLINQFIKKNNLVVNLISSHGHTIFHQPENGFTTQIGHGAYIHAETNLPVVCDFRTIDVALGGQGAPLVPVGDAYLFGEYDACLNLGGIANISYKHHNDLHAFDISPCNIVLNHVAHWMNLEYDNHGNIAAKGTTDTTLLEELNNLDFYNLTGPKSLGREWINTVFWPIVKKYNHISVEDKMATLSSHIAEQISHIITKSGVKNVLVTGGGAFNNHLILNIKKKCVTELVIPDPVIINFKEALIFAFLGVLRVKNNSNTLMSVTGASQNSIGGALYGSFQQLK